MNKITIAILTALTVATASAEYTVKLPLQSDNGGTLPQGSINIAPMSQPEEWLPISPIYTLWADVGQSYDCTNWTPDPSTITIGQSFTQTANDCKQDQTRTRQEREQETTSLEIRDAGTPIAESQTITSITTRDAVGTLENWIATTPTYTDWADSGAIYGCSNWSPDPSTVNSGQAFTQTATDCKQNQTRSRQDREQETTTLTYRNAGSPVTEAQILTGQSSTRTAVGTKVILTCKYELAGSPGYIWFVDSNTSMQDSLWWGITMQTINQAIRAPRNTTTFSYNGTIYERGVLKQTVSGGTYYEICKVN